MAVPKISVVIPTHNRHDQLVHTISHLVNQDIPTSDYEIIVVDDGSKPPVELPEDWLKSNIHLIRTSGVERSAARNFGAEAARGKILIFLDDDISVEPTFLTAHLNAQIEWQKVLAVGSIRLPISEFQKPFVRFRQQLEDQSLSQCRGLVSAKNFCAAGNMSIRREVFLDLGGFNPDFTSSEDQDLALRHTTQGGQIAYLPEASGVHYDRALDIRNYCRRMEWGYSAMTPFNLSFPNWPDNVEREKVNGFLRWGREPVHQSIRKLFKSVLSFPPVVTTLLCVTLTLERVAPSEPVLNRLYRTLLGIHIFRGYRKGLRQVRNEDRRKIDFNGNRKAS